MIPPLRLVFWELTPRCNLQCRHCRAGRADAAGPAELDREALLYVAESIRTAGDPILILTGGEPLLREDFFAVAGRCAQLFSRVALATNGTLVGPEMARRLVATGLQRVSVSLDGADAPTHDRFRGLPGSFAAAWAGCRALRAAGMSLQINATVTRHNREQLPDLVELALALGADAFHLFVLVPVGCGVEIPAADRLDAAAIETCLQSLHALSQRVRGRLHVKATCAPQYYRILHAAGELEAPRADAGAGHGLHAVTRGCLAGTGVCFVSHHGEVQPCGYLPLSVGNVRVAPLATLWQSAPLFATLRDPARLQGACGACPHRERCQGCRARAYAETGDCLGPDPDCAFAARAATAGEHG